ncbi:MAG TPA: efflux RND transporter periplasmic adaptor subunit [Vicinamibacterales bacterium]|jgi:HlyD family secretion protein|nr:efflux RND transporter periplasmic adaptor subunit [Vicinamibacterales bacterium]
MTRKKIWIGAGIVVVLAAIAYANFAFHRTTTTSVTAEKIARHDLEAIVSASGKIQAKRTVNISAETVGKVVNLDVDEGDIVKIGQPLLQIDPRILQNTVESREASLATARAQLSQTRAQVDSTRVALQQSKDSFARQEGLFKQGLLSRDEYDRGRNDVQMREADLASGTQSIAAQEQRIKQEEAGLESARYDLNKVRIVSPINGIVTKRNIEEGETVVTGTMNNAGTVLLTIADLSIIEAEIEVDETDIPYTKVGQIAKVTIDAMPGKTFTGKVTEVGNSPITSTTTSTASRATNFKVVVTIDGQIPDVRPGFTCTADITTATRQKALGVPIQAMTVRELVVDEHGAIVPVAPPAPGTSASKRPTAPAELKPGQTRKEFEGAFLIKDGKAAFVPVKTGIAGEKYFEVLDGLKEADEVITGPFASVRTMKDGDPVKVTTAAAAGTAAK